MYFSLREGINPLKGFLGSRHTCKDSITRQNFNRSSKEQTNMVLPSLDRLSYIHCLLREFLPNKNYKRLFSSLPAPVPLYLLLTELKR